MKCELVDSLFVSGRYRLWLKEVTTGKVLLVDQATDPPELGRVTYVDWEPEAATLLPA